MVKEYKMLQKDSVSKMESDLREYWNDIDLLNKSVNSREGKSKFVFYDGPPTANGKPGIHHVIARALKDSICRYKTMQGFQVKRKAGWDTHGLPVEIEVEKRLQLNNKQAIEDYGIEKFNKECRNSVFEYEAAWREQTKRMAYLIDLDNPYITLDNDYIETEWYILNKFFEENMIYEGHKILPYCARCGTGLASHEVAQGYEEIKTATVTVKFKRKDMDEYFLVWTTTPWTLSANVCLTVNPKETYVKVLQDGVTYIIEQHLANKVMGDDIEVIDNMIGSDMEGWEYEQLMPFVSTDDKAFIVTLGEHVTTEDGTGIVHSAPAFGEDDYQIGKKYGLPVLQPVDEEGKYTTTPWKGKFVIDADPEIILWLKEHNLLYKKETVSHNYPHCWRCKTPLLYYAKQSWYIEMTRLQDKLIENNNGVNWYPHYVGEKRFGNWLENLNDWAISRSRYWGTPLNIWRCDKCDKLTSVGSRAELIERAIETIDESIDLHRPYVDDIHLTCECGAKMSRVPDVIDCWFDSGSMPFAQRHWPFGDKKEFDDAFPADFICEGIDQTRGWFYSLLAISTFVSGKSPYKNVLVNDLILDKDGKKMSKSRGNTVDAIELFDKYGADVVRWYLYYVSPAWVPTRFDESGIQEVNSKFFSTLKNVYTFFAMYANMDGVNAREIEIKVSERSELDRWIISKLMNLIDGVQKDFDVFDTTKAVRKIQDFVNEDLSNWYIRRSRRRFWGSELTDDKRAVYRTTYEVLVAICQLSAPFAPYITELLYRNLTEGLSVHLSYFPEINKDYVDEYTETKMDLVRTLVALGRRARESVKIKVRQPISQVMVDGKYKELISDLVPLIKEELNVKNVVFTDDLSEYMNFSLKPNFRTLGPILGKKMGLFTKALAGLHAGDIATKLDKGESVEIMLGDEIFTSTAEHILVSVDSKDGFTVGMDGNVFIILETTLTEELISEGYAREMISRVQQQRKAFDFEVTDFVNIKYSCDDEFHMAVEAFSDYIKKETLCENLMREESVTGETVHLNGKEVVLDVKQV